MIRKASFNRKTKETDISLALELASAGAIDIKSGVPFFDHVLSAFAKHARLGLSLICAGDLQVDAHHSVEDIGICLGTALRTALGDKAGIRRFGSVVLPMDEALVLAAMDLSGRPWFAYEGTELRGYIGNYSEELTLDFMQALCSACGMNLHIRVLSGRNRHHIHEAVFKALGLALYEAVSIDPIDENSIPSTKGIL